MKKKIYVICAALLSYAFLCDESRRTESAPGEYWEFYGEPTVWPGGPPEDILWV